MASLREERKIRIVCGTCGSETVTRDAWAEWDVGAQNWALGAVYDYAYCHNCENDSRLEEVPFVAWPFIRLRFPARPDHST